MKKLGVLMGVLLLFIVGGTGCSSKQEFSEEYDPNTDYQYTYVDTFDGNRKVQYGNGGEYIWYNDFIYFYNEESKALNPLCNKVNCLHDHEMDEDRLKECNAYTGMQSGDNYVAISYYDDNVYFVKDGTLYRISQNGSKKDAIYTLEDEVPIYAWIIHRGVLYYDTQEYYSPDGEKVCTKVSFKRIELSSHMSEKKAETIFESDESVSVLTLSSLRAYKNVLYFKVIARDNNKSSDGTEDGWVKALNNSYFYYNLETKELNEIEIPDGYGEYADISEIIFLNEKVLIRICDETLEQEYKFPVLYANYDMSNMAIWMEELEQGKSIQVNGDKVVISDADIQYFEKENKNSIHVSVYDTNAKCIDTFIYPLNNMGNLCGSGVNGELLEIIDDDSNWYIYGFNLNSIGNYNGKEVKLELKSTRKIGTLNNLEE